MRASTARLVEAGDAERRRLERDLHDGAQQRLLALGIALERTPAAAAARTRLRAMREDLRRIAHGIHSVPLAEGGLAEAVLALVDAAGAAVTVEVLPDRRASVAAEAALYRLVADGLAAGARCPAGDRGADGALTADPPGGVDADLTEALANAGARIAAVGGELTVERRHRARSRADLGVPTGHRRIRCAPRCSARRRSATVMAPTTKEEP